MTNLLILKNPVDNLSDTFGKKMHTEVDYFENEYFVFGSEGDGLPEEILDNKYIESVRIPMNKDSRSINLSNQFQ